MKHFDQVNIASREHKRDPYPYYKRLRELHPVHPVKLPDKRIIWLVTRYEDVAEILRDKRLAKDLSNAPGNRTAEQPWIPRFAKPLTQHMLNKDSPEHTRLKGLVTQAFSTKMIEKMSDRISTLSTELLNRVGGRKSIDLIADFALPIPTTVIAEMLGVPVEDGNKFNRWSNAIIQAVSSRWGMVRSVPEIWSFVRYIRRFIQMRQRKPQDDLVSELIRAETDGQRLDEDELVAMVFLLLFAGHETTVNLIGNGVLALLEHPEQMQLLRRNPDLIDSAVEEMLRHSSPVEMATERYAREDIPIGGSTIPAGSLVGAVIASANRDENQFENAEILDIKREPNKHLAFGSGPHYCTGAALARLEGKIAINTLLKRIPQIELIGSPDKLRWRRGLVTRGLEALPVRIGN